jgi:hypothetical protein
MASCTLPPSSYMISFRDQSRVNNLGIYGLTERTMHKNPSKKIKILDTTYKLEIGNKAPKL